MSKLGRNTNLRTFTISTSSGKNVKDTSQLKGEAKDSLSGRNTITEHRTANHGGSGPYGGMNSSK